MIRRIFLLFFAMYVCAMSVSAVDYIDTSKPDEFITHGVRVSLNNSSVGVNYKDIFSGVKEVDSDWKTGFEVGYVIDIHLKKYFSLQPGVFFQNKSYGSSIITTDGGNNLTNIFKHSRFYYFNVPVMASFKFNMSNNFDLLAEIGPYFSFGLGGDTDVEEISFQGNQSDAEISRLEYEYDYFGSGNMKNVQMRKFDWGIKMGFGVLMKRKYSFGIYYSAGCENIANTVDSYMKNASARNKQWSFVLGYNF